MFSPDPKQLNRCVIKTQGSLFQTIVVYRQQLYIVFLSASILHFQVLCSVASSRSFLHLLLMDLFTLLEYCTTFLFSFFAPVPHLVREVLQHQIQNKYTLPQLYEVDEVKRLICRLCNVFKCV